MANGKSKGNEFERSISKIFSNWWTNHERDDVFWRTQNSGGRFTNRSHKGLKTHNQGGDICSVHPDGELFSSLFFVECKNYKNIGLWTLVTKKGLLSVWWYKALSDSAKDCKIPLLVVKENNKPIIIFFPSKFLHIFNFENDEFILFFHLSGEETCMCLLDDFLSLNIDVFKENCSKYLNNKDSICE